MGLRGRFKKGSGEKDKEEIGGLIKDSSEHGGGPPPPAEGGPTGGGTFGGGTMGAPQPEAPSQDRAAEMGESGSGLGNLDIFSQETDGESENTLADSLPEVDIHDLLMGCQDLAADLAEYD